MKTATSKNNTNKQMGDELKEMSKVIGKNRLIMELPYGCTA